MNDRPFQRCTRCVMDTTDSKITFDENGVCDHCRNFDKNIGNQTKIELMNCKNWLKKYARPVKIMNMIVF